MDHGEQDGEPIGTLLSSLATTLREVSDKLDAVAAHVDDRDDRDVVERLAKLEAWAFRAGDDISNLETRVERVESGSTVTAAPTESSSANGRSAPAPLPTRTNNRETGTPVVSDIQPERAPSTPLESPAATTSTLPRSPLPRSARRDPAATGERAESGTPATQHGPATITPRTSRVDTARSETIEPFGPATHNETFGPRNGRVDTAAPTLSNQRIDPAAARNGTEWPDAVPNPHSSESAPPRLTPPSPSASTATPRPDWADYSTPASNGQLESPTATNHTDHGAAGSGNGRLEPPPASRADTGMTTPPTDESPLPPGAHRAAGEDTSHVDKLQAMLDELKRNGPFGARTEQTDAPVEMPGIDPHFAVRTEG
ncbi:hypothetical protein [Nocardia australiensis]|uniref:hypothetical protein n=1 Tax=Nocardia australiensis TaxID=2887191 RepID=UPI001D148E51|nr:hypothetical protein [Nocardia australiensis]